MTLKLNKSHNLFLFILVLIIVGVFVSGCQGSTILDQESPGSEDLENVDQVKVSDENTSGNVENEAFLKQLTQEELNYIEGLRSSGGLKIATRWSDTVYFKDDVTGELTGFHYNLANKLASELEVDLNITIVEFEAYFTQNGSLPDDIKTRAYTYKPDLFNQVHIFSDNLTKLVWRQGLMEFVDIAPVTIAVISDVKNPIHRPEDMDGKAYMINPNTSYDTALTEFINKHGLNLETIYVSSGEIAIAAVANGEVDFTVKDSNKALGEMQRFPNLKMGLAISEIQSIGWAVDLDNHMMQSILSKYISYITENKTLDALWKAEYGVTLREYSQLLGIMNKK